MRTSSSAIKPIATPALAGRYRRTRKRGDGGETGVSDTEDHPERRPDRVCLRAHPGKATAARPPLVVALNRKLDPPRAGNWGQSFSSRRSSAWLEQRSFKPRVRGSNPRAGTNRVSDYASLYPTMRMERSNSASVYPTALVERVLPGPARQPPRSRRRPPLRIGPTSDRGSCVEAVAMGFNSAQGFLFMCVSTVK